MLSDRIGFVRVVLAFFLNGAPSPLARSICHFLGGYIVFSSIPLENLDRTGFNASAIRDTRIPINSHHSAVYSNRDLFFSPCRIGCFYFFVFCGLFILAWTPYVMKVFSIGMVVFTYYLLISWKVWIDRHSYLTTYQITYYINCLRLRAMR